MICEPPGVLRVDIVAGGNPAFISARLKSIDELGFAQARADRHDSIEHRLQLRRRAADDAQHLAGRGLVFERFLQLLRPRLLGLEQPRVLDGDHRLVGEGRDQLDLMRR